MLEEVEFVNKYVKTSHVIKMMLKGAMSINLKEDVINLVILQLQSLPIVNLETPKKAKIYSYIFPFLQFL